MTKLNSREEIFSKTPVFEAILRLALPTVIGQIILVIYNLADTFFIGLSGSDAMITSVTVCMPAFMLLSAISNLFGVGGSSVIATALGKGERRHASLASSFSFYGCFIVTCIYSACTFAFIDGFVDILGGSNEAVHAYAREYLLYTVVIGGIFTSMNAFLAHLIRSEGRSGQASAGVAFGGLLNVALDPLFMFVIMPKGMEPVAVAIATTVSNAAATLYFAIVIYKERRTSVLSFKPCREMVSHKIPRRVLAIGLPACVMTLFENVSYAIMDNLLAVHGTALQAGMGVAKKINMLAHCIVRGMTQGVLPLIAFNHGAGKYKRMKQSVVYSATLSVGVACVCTVLYSLFAPQLVSLFIPAGTQSVEYGAKCLQILCIGAPFSAFGYSAVSFFQAVGHGKESFMLAILRKGIVDIPLMFALRLVIPVFGVVWATPITDCVCCIGAVFMLMHYQKAHRMRHPAPAADPVHA